MKYLFYSIYPIYLIAGIVLLNMDFMFADKIALFLLAYTVNVCLIVGLDIFENGHKAGFVIFVIGILLSIGAITYNFIYNLTGFSDFDVTMKFISIAACVFVTLTNVGSFILYRFYRDENKVVGKFFLHLFLPVICSVGLFILVELLFISLMLMAFYYGAKLLFKFLGEAFSSSGTTTTTTSTRYYYYNQYNQRVDLDEYAPGYYKDNYGHTYTSSDGVNFKRIS